MPKFDFKKSGLIILGMVITYLAMVVIVGFIYTPKIAYVDTKLLMEKYPPAINAKKEFDSKTKEWEKNKKVLEDELNQINQEIVEKSTSMDKKALVQKQEVFKKKQIDYARYSKAINEKAMKLEQEIFQPVYDKLNLAIKEFGNEKGYSIILGTMDGGNILYAENSSNITNNFLEYASEKEK